ncbi:Na+/proline symporter [Catalinimonas alkaloidigena]|uniref:sodium:solute symporter n=1 Tax=Catalinimonas alkaloidigena TaxID=1075417 RepID=UPI002404E28E|nr:sodium:solute symporter [Catalinimonas alkaloidigena]MDF9794790.1 Na+/proline symporter [Catalinimonas alkaloidigena]
MSPILVLSVIAGYFVVLLLISYFTSRGATTQTFFNANRSSPWYLVAFGMIGASLSGVTFISVPGEVGNSQFSYFQVVLGYVPGYAFIALVLMPLYYRLNLVSIYGYLERRFGFWSYKTGAFFFLLSRLIGSSARLFLVAGVLQIAIFDSFDVPFWITVFVTIVLIWLYTFRGGIKTIVWTDTLQTFFMLSSVAISIFLIGQELEMSLGDMIANVERRKISKIFFWDWDSANNFFKQFISGAFIAIVMTGLDQDMMQKNLTCKNLGEAQKNMKWFTVTIVFVTLMFLTLGALLFLYADTKGIAIPESTDDLYPMLAVNHFDTYAGIIFMLGIIAAAYSSADSALTALTTSFCVDFLGLGNERAETRNEKGKDIDKAVRMRVHVMFSVLLFLVILLFNAFNSESVIVAVFKIAGYTYGPLLGLYSYGLYTSKKAQDRLVPWVCLLAPVISFVLDTNSAILFNGFQFGFFILIVNGALTFIGLLLISKGQVEKERLQKA